jgi:DNA polymerase-3 subunit beta
MKFKINRDHFSSGLQQVLNVVGTRATMPILSNVLIEASDNAINLTTTNLDLGIRCKIKADVSEDGGITLPVRKLANIVRELPNLDVVLETSPNYQAKITSGGSLFRIMGINEEEFPSLPTFDDDHVFMLSQGDLGQMLKSVSYAQSTDETRYIMNGVFFTFGEGKLTLAATDGRRLAVTGQAMEVGEDKAGHLILPAKTVAEVERLLGQGEEVRIAFNDRQVAFELNTEDTVDSTGLIGGIYLVSKVVEGNYPNYKQVIPKETELRIKVERELLLDCVRRAALVTSDKSNTVKIKVTENLMEIMGSSPEYGESHESVAVQYAGPEVTVAFNPEFVVHPLKAVTRDEVIFEFKDELSPGVIRTTDDFLCVIMPLRLN